MPRVYRSRHYSPPLIAYFILLVCQTLCFLSEAGCWICWIQPKVDLSKPLYYLFIFEDELFILRLSSQSMKSFPKCLHSTAHFYEIYLVPFPMSARLWHSTSRLGVSLIGASTFWVLAILFFAGNPALNFLPWWLRSFIHLLKSLHPYKDG